MASNSIRDSQRKKLYRAERIAFHGGIEENYTTPDYRTVAEAQAYVDYVTASDTWKALGFSHLGMFESYPLTVKDGRGGKRGAASAFANTLKLPKFSRRKWYIMHELAHIATSYIHDFAYDDEDEDGGAWPGDVDPETDRVVLIENVALHGPEFAGIYLHLLRELVGVAAYDKLQAAFEETGVKVVSPEVAVTVSDTLVEQPAVTDTDTDTAASEACLECGMVLGTGAARKKFCSDRCRWTHHNRGRSVGTHEKTCVVCGVEFVARRADATTCSARCRKRRQRLE